MIRKQKQKQTVQKALRGCEKVKKNGKNKYSPREQEVFSQRKAIESRISQ